MFPLLCNPKSSWREGLQIVKFPVYNFLHHSVTSCLFGAFQISWTPVETAQQLAYERGIVSTNIKTQLNWNPSDLI
jgi:hypothetical protein